MSAALRRRNLAGLGLALMSAVVFGVLQVRLVGFQTLDSLVQDIALRARTPQSYLDAGAAVDPREFITIVAIDERTIAELGAYNGGYPRALQALLVDRLLAGQPRVIAFDVGFFEPTPSDDELAGALDRARAIRPPTRIVLAAAGTLAAGVDAPPAIDGEFTFDQGLLPLPAFARNADLAVTNVLPDERGTIRSMPLLVRLGDRELPTLGLAAMSGYLRRPGPIDTRPAPDVIQIAGRQIPVDPVSSRVRINYFGPPSGPNRADSTFDVVSFVDVLRGRVDPQVWRNRMIFVGALGATGLADDYWTPMSQQGRKMAGVEIHANVAATLFSTQFLHEPPVPIQLAMVLVLAIAITLLAANLGVLPGLATVVSLLSGFVFACIWIANGRGWLLPVSAPLGASLVPFVGILAYRILLEQRQARGLRSALAAVLPPSVAREIARDPDRLRLGGERRTITVLFTDLKGFTPFAERVAPELLSRVVTEYLDAMTRVAFRHGGTVDKFIGDAVMVLWNAPLDDPDHARRACEAAIDMQTALAKLSDRWESEGLPRQEMRIGIHTGPASVGNMGTSQRFAYTALGDTVNLGARLEPLNKVYGTSICISRATLEAAGGEEQFDVRYLDRLEVKGKTEPTAVYELIGPQTHAAIRLLRAA